MVADTLVYHPAVSHYIRFIATTLGRDKALRLLQYLGRFLSWYLLRKGYSASAIAPWEAIKKQFGTGRRIMRVGKNVEHLKAVSVALDNKSLSPVSRYLTAARQLGYFGFLTLDTISFLDVSGIRPLPNLGKRIQRDTMRCWLAGITFSLAHSIYSLRELSEREKVAKKTEPEGRLEAKKIQKERVAVKTQAICDVCDITVPLSALGLVALDDGMVGLLGLVSSYIGLRAQWRKTA